MKRSSSLLVAMLLCGIAAPPAAAQKRPAPSGPLRAYKGPEGEVIVMVAVNDSTQMLIHFKNMGGSLEGRTFLYMFEDRGDDKAVYTNRKRGSKTYRSIILSARDRRWEFFHPTEPKTRFHIRYSESASKEIRLEDVLKAYKP